MALNASIGFVLIAILLNSVICEKFETNCTSVESFDGTVGVDCDRSKSENYTKYEPTVIEQHFVELFERTKRDTRGDEQNGGPIEMEISEMFIQNLAVMNGANMSDCMDRVNCEEKCQIIASGLVRAPVDDSSKVEGLDDLPEFVRTFYEAGKRGISLGRTEHCGDCQKFYTKCNAMQYDYTIKTNALYKDLIERNVTLFEANTKERIPSEIAYLHNSMRFLDLANLSRCYARVSCEATCTQIKADPTIEAPPAKSPLLQNDPHKPPSVDIIHDGAILGYKLAFSGTCHTCGHQYADCPQDKYSIAHTSSIIFS